MIERWFLNRPVRVRGKRHRRIPWLMATTVPQTRQNRVSSTFLSILIIQEPWHRENRFREENRSDRRLRSDVSKGDISQMAFINCLKRYFETRSCRSPRKRLRVRRVNGIFELQFFGRFREKSPRGIFICAIKFRVRITNSRSLSNCVSNSKRDDYSKYLKMFANASWSVAKFVSRYLRKKGIAQVSRRKTVAFRVCVREDENVGWDATMKAIDVGRRHKLQAIARTGIPRNRSKRVTSRSKHSFSIETNGAATFSRTSKLQRIIILHSIRKHFNSNQLCPEPLEPLSPSYEQYLIYSIYIYSINYYI